MIWVVLLILAIVAFFGYKGLHSRHVARCRYDERTHEHVPESISEQTEHKAFHEKHAAMSNQGNGMPAERVPPQRGGPSLLYAERNEQQAAGTEQATSDSVTNTSASAQSGNTPASSPANEPTSDIPSHSATESAAETTTSSTADKQWQENVSDSMDFTAETATLSSDEVGTPANSSDYDQIDTDQIDTDQIDTNQLDHEFAEITLEKNADTIYESVDTEQASKHIADSTQSSAYSDTSNAGIAAAGVAAAAAGIGIANTQYNVTNQETAQHNQSTQHEVAANASSGAIQQTEQPTAFAEGIDLELGDSTHNEEDIDDNDELLDFGDLTADISEMLKELNLREADSPRLEINQDEFAQLKTGEPGEVKQEKIEDVAGKLRNMLQ